MLLDEPTVGADISTRAALVDVVKRLADDGTAVLYSTHYLQEVESLGAAVVLLDHGRVIAQGSLADLVGRYGVGALELHFEGPAPALRVEGLPVAIEDACLRVATGDPAAVAVDVLGALGADAARLRRVDVVHPSLDSVFLTLTGERWRSDEERADVAVS